MAKWYVDVWTWRKICPDAEHYYARVRHSEDSRKNKRHKIRMLTKNGALEVAKRWFDEHKSRGDRLIVNDVRPDTI